MADLKRDEGLRLTAYQDTGGVLTIGYGHTGPDVKPGMVWSQEEADDTLATDVASHVSGLDRQLPWWRQLDDIRQDVLANMAFNLGVRGLLEFKTFLAFVQKKQFAQAALDLSGTAWFHQVGQRAVRLVAQMRSGLHQT